jgi:ribonuclease E
MTKRMLIDASHPEETRVAVLDGNRLEAFDIESANRLPLKGNIYLARVVRVEPSLQAAFVEYGGNRHGFLAFGEIHPDYYQIPVADRQRLLEMQRAEADEERRREEAEDAARANDAALNDALESAVAEPPAAAEEPGEDAGAAFPAAADTAEPEAPARLETEVTEAVVEAAPVEATAEVALPPEGMPAATPDATAEGEDHLPGEAGSEEAAAEEETGAEAPYNGDAEPQLPPETVGGSTEDDVRERRIPPKFLRHYKIQEVIKRRQIMLVQVVKEERGTKGAALTTYISLAGRFSVLMPNSPRGGGVSRKITSAADRKRLREAIDELGLPDGMSLIVRTAGAQRPKPEIKKDCEYLLRLWDGIRERTFASTAPALIYEEADLIKRSIRDTYGKDVEEVLVDGDDAYNDAREFMRMLMPAHANKVRISRDGVPLFARYGVDSQLEGMHNPTVQLRSGGYIVINQTEALVAIDVNSGRATRDRHIEDTALRTNLEAADEVARQLRLRDLAGLIVIDFIDMESSKHDGMVERRLKEALKQDRARIQVGRISHFGLLEMSRQRLRPSLVEHAFITCPHCQGRGLVRSIESSGLTVLRAIEEEGAKRRAAEIVVHVATPIAFWLLNRKRDRLAAMEERFGMTVLVQSDDTLIPPALRIERTRAQNPDAIAERPAALRMDYAPEPEEAEVAEEAEVVETARAEAPARAEAEGRGETDESGRRRRRRRRRGGRREGTEGGPADAGAEEGEDEAEEGEATAAEPAAEPGSDAEPEAEAETEGEGEASEAEGGDSEEAMRRRRRGRRGGRRRRPEGEAGAEGPAPGPAAGPATDPALAPAPQPVPVAITAAPPPRRAPTPADPFAGQMDEILMAMEAAEQQAAERATRSRRPAEPVAEPVAEPAAPVVETPAAPEPVPAVVAEVPASPEPAPAAEPMPAPAAEAAPVAAAPPEPEAAASAGAEPQIGAPVAPIVLGGEAPTELPRKRGWWKK